MDEDGKNAVSAASNFVPMLNKPKLPQNNGRLNTCKSLASYV